MALMERFAELTPAQREQFASVKDSAALDAFLSAQGIELTAEEKTQAVDYFENGVMPLDDDDLDTVAGGAAKDESEALALAEGRKYVLPACTTTCWCHHKNKWAASIEKDVRNGIRYHRYFHDVKCYKCGATWNVIEVIG